MLRLLNFFIILTFVIAIQTYKSDDNDADRDKNVSNVCSNVCLGRINQTLR